MRLKLLGATVLIAILAVLAVQEIGRERAERAERARALNGGDARPDAQAPDRPEMEPSPGQEPRNPAETGAETPEQVQLPLEVRFHEAATGVPLEGGTASFEEIPIAGSTRFFKVEIVFHPPEGWTARHGTTVSVKGRASVFADRFRLRIPLVPDAPLRFRFRYPDGSIPADSIDVYGDLGMGPEPIRVRLDQLDADGTARLRGVRFEPGVRLRLAFAHRGRFTHFEEHLPKHRAPTEYPVVLTDPASRTNRVLESSELDEDLEYEEALEEELEDAPPPGTMIDVTATRISGAPAAGARARLTLGQWEAWSGKLDRDGRARIQGLYPDVYRFEVDDPGFLAEPVKLAVTAGSVTTTLVRESPGWTARLLVVDREHRPIPGARVWIKPSYAAIRDGVQELALFSGPDGRIELSRLPDRGATVRCGRERLKVTRDGAGSTYVLRVLIN